MDNASYGVTFSQLRIIKYENNEFQKALLFFLFFSKSVLAVFELCLSLKFQTTD